MTMTYRRRLRAPDHPGEHVVAADGRAEQVLAATAAAGRRTRPTRRAAGEAVRGEQRREDRGEQEDRAEHQARDEHAALQADALAQLRGSTGSGRASRRRRLARRRWRLTWWRWTCQYLTLGSMSAAMMSTMKFVTATIDGEQHDDALDGDEVAGLQVLVEQEAEALPLEGRLGEHRAAEQQRDLQADDRDDRDQRRPVGVLAEQPALAARRGSGPPRRSRVPSVPMTLVRTSRRKTPAVSRPRAMAGRTACCEHVADDRGVAELMRVDQVDAGRVSAASAAGSRRAVRRPARDRQPAQATPRRRA